MIREHDQVVLTTDLPEHGFKAGDVGTVVYCHGTEGYKVEFMTVAGETIAVVTVYAKQIRPVTPQDIAHARPLDKVF